ncbi:hypothetical protein NR218_07865 [Staphylococcus sp. SUC_1.2]|uniref:hypothetical protein n=1 Tax=Staphylococcus sp. SUC_1.2 TaxID=2969256 RepID=UPI002246C807|nr:hypothetical protein [Staphylococcus sp. SUC_1.2]MCW9140953.1 hypothetical protein [Staphylococcus sp. SUC_1.2]
MKKLLGTLFAATLVLSACSQDDTKEDENKKSESTTEKKTDDKKDKNTKEDKKSKEEKKTQENEDNKSTQEDNSTEEQNTQETATNEQVQSQQPATQEQQQAQQNGEYDSTKHSDEYNASHPVSTDDDWTPEEQQRYDEGMKEIERLEQKNQELSDPTYDPNNPYMNMPNQEWRNNAGGLSSGEIQTRNEILKGTYEGEDAQQKLDAINYYEEKYSN